MHPIPRRKPAIDKSTASGRLSITEGNVSPRREARKPDLHSPLATQQASLEKAKREGFPRKDSSTIIKTLRFKKGASKADRGSQTYSSSPLPSSSRSSSSSASFTADGGSGIAQALNHAVANNNRSSVDTDVLMSNFDEPRPALDEPRPGFDEPRPVPNPIGPAEKTDDVKAELTDLRREFTHLKTTVLQNATSAIHVSDHGSSFINC